MRIYQDKSNIHSKSWSIRLCDDGISEIGVVAVDSFDGKEIVWLICFDSSGKVSTVSNAYLSLFDDGYDPYEHNNKWAANGALIISTGKYHENKKLAQKQTI